VADQVLQFVNQTRSMPDPGSVAVSSIRKKR
jgi:hypothetical protein